MIIAGIFLSFIWGTIWGSFGSTIVYRTNRGMSIVKPPSLCPNCGKILPWRHKIPILSYVVLGGKCGFCGAKINPFYIITEFLSGITGVFAFIFSDSTLSFLLNFFFLWSLLILTISDIMYLHIPVLNIVIATASAVVYQMVQGDYKDMIWGMLIGVSIPLVILLLYKFLRKKEGIGEGDILVMFPVGAYFGFSETLTIFILSTLLGGFVSLILLILGKSRESMIPFVPFIFISVILVFLLERLYLTDLRFVPRFLW